MEPAGTNSTCLIMKVNYFLVLAALCGARPYCRTPSLKHMRTRNPQRQHQRMSPCSSLFNYFPADVPPAVRCEGELTPIVIPRRDLAATANHKGRGGGLELAIRLCVELESPFTFIRFWRRRRGFQCCRRQVIPRTVTLAVAAAPRTLADIGRSRVARRVVRRPRS